MRKLKMLLLLTVLAVVLAACGGSNEDAAEESDANGNVGEGEEKDTIIVGTSPGPYSELFLDAIVPILEEDGYEIERVDFTELLQADIALQEGSIDVNVDQHTAYYTNFNNERDANLTGLTPIPTVPTGIY